MRAGIAGAACRIGRQFADGVEPVIREVVREALDKSGLSLADIDLVTTVASDTLDGMMVPIRAELAGAFGKTYLNAPSSAGHGLSAAAAAIEAGDARTALVVGWGAASKLAEADGRSNQFDPFYMRPLGATPKVLAALQKQILTASNTLSQNEIEAFRDRMAGLLWLDAGADEAHPYRFCDGAAALVLKRSSSEAPGVIVAEYSTASRSHSPLDGSFDPALWVSEAVERFSKARAGAAAPSGLIEVGGSTVEIEMRAIATLLRTGLVRCGTDAANRTGGGAMAWFGPASGLRVLAEMWALMSTERDRDAALFADLAGPLGQHVTTVLLERRSEA